MIKKIFFFFLLMLPGTYLYAGEGEMIVSGMNKLWALTRPIGWAILACAFAWSLIQETAKVHDGGTPAYGKVIWETVLIAIVMGAISKIIFPGIVNTCNAVGETARSLVTWKDFLDAIGDAFVQKNILGLLGAPVVTLFSGISAMIATQMEFILYGARSAILCVLFVMAPIAVACGAAKETRNIFKGWLLGVLQVSFWVVILGILQSVTMAFYLAAIKVTSGVNVSLLYVSLTYTIMVILIPLLTGKILSGENLGSVGTIAIGVLTGAFAAIVATPIAKASVPAGVLLLSGHPKKAWNSIVEATKPKTITRRR